MKDLQLSGRSSAKFSSRILKLTTSPLTILHTDLSSFLQANLSKPKNLPGRSRPSFDSVAFLHQRHLGLPDKNTTDFAKNTSSNKVHKFFLSPFFFLGGGWIYIYIWRFSKKDPNRHHPSIHLCWGKGCQHPPRLHRFNPLGSQETEGRPSEHQELMLTILTGKFGFFQREKTRQQQQKREEKKTAWPRKSQSDVCFLIWFQFCSIDASYIF